MTRLVTTCCGTRALLAWGLSALLLATPIPQGHREHQIEWDIQPTEGLSKCSCSFFFHSNPEQERELDLFQLTSEAWGFPGGASVKNLPANAGVETVVGSIPGSRRSPRGGHGNPLQYSCVENPMVRGAWRATVHGVAESDTHRRHGSPWFSEPDQCLSHR